MEITRGIPHGDRALAEIILLGKIAGIVSLATQLSQMWELPLLSNIHSDQGQLGITQIKLRSIKNLVTDLQDDTKNFFDKNYSELWNVNEAEND